MSPYGQPWSPSTMWWYVGSFGVFVFAVSFALSRVELPGSLLLIAAAAVGFNAVVLPLLGLRERPLQVVLSDVPQRARKSVRRAIVAGAVPADPTQRAVAGRLATEALGETLRHRVVYLVVIAGFAALVALFAVTIDPVAWLVVGVDLVALLVQLLWPMWLRRRVAVLGPAG